jgi:hypothetical protein
MVRKVQPPETTPQVAKPPPEEANFRPREKKQLPDRAEVDRLRAELQAELTGDDRERVQEAARICRLASPRAAERLALIVYGLQPATPPQVVMSSIAVLKGGGVVDKHDAGVTAETTEAAE